MTASNLKWNVAASEANVDKRLLSFLSGMLPVLIGILAASFYPAIGELAKRLCMAAESLSSPHLFFVCVVWCCFSGVYSVSFSHLVAIEKNESVWIFFDFFLRIVSVGFFKTSKFF